MDEKVRIVDLPEIEAKKIFSEVIDYEFKLINIITKGEFETIHPLTRDDYYRRFYKEYMKLFLARAKIIKRRNN